MLKNKLYESLCMSCYIQIWQPYCSTHHRKCAAESFFSELLTRSLGVNSPFDITLFVFFSVQAQQDTNDNSIQHSHTIWEGAFCALTSDVLEAGKQCANTIFKIFRILLALEWFKITQESISRIEMYMS